MIFINFKKALNQTMYLRIVFRRSIKYIVKYIIKNNAFQLVLVPVVKRLTSFQLYTAVTWVSRNSLFMLILT